MDNLTKITAKYKETSESFLTDASEDDCKRVYKQITDAIRLIELDDSERSEYDARRFNFLCNKEIIETVQNYSCSMSVNLFMEVLQCNDFSVIYPEEFEFII